MLILEVSFANPIRAATTQSAWAWRTVATVRVSPDMIATQRIRRPASVCQSQIGFDLLSHKLF